MQEKQFLFDNNGVILVYEWTLLFSFDLLCLL